MPANIKTGQTTTCTRNVEKPTRSFREHWNAPSGNTGETGWRRWKTQTSGLLIDMHLPLQEMEARQEYPC